MAVRRRNVPVLLIRDLFIKAFDFIGFPPDYFYICKCLDYYIYPWTMIWPYWLIC